MGGGRRLWLMNRRALFARLVSKRGLVVKSVVRYHLVIDSFVDQRLCPSSRLYHPAHSNCCTLACSLSAFRVRSVLVCVELLIEVTAIPPRWHRDNLSPSTRLRSLFLHDVKAHALYLSSVDMLADSPVGTLTTYYATQSNSLRQFIYN